MTALEKIPILVEAPEAAAQSYLNTLPLLHEILHALRRLHRDGTSTALDLLAMPFGPGDEARLFEFLGNGELSAELDAMGQSSIRESRFSGVWIIEHKSSGGRRVALQIEVTRLPAILQTQPEDIGAGLDAMQEALETLKAGEPV
ncbi:MAG: hydrogenase accessory protein HupE [Gammaproteobacteria bacterium]|nr:hydrogenase accessory protein HupE [Gammaproteobacteria bacterium]